MPLIWAELRKFGPDQVDLDYCEQETRRNALLQELGQLEPQRKSVQQEIRSLLTTIARLERGPETLAHIQEREKESGRLKLDIDRLKVELDAVTRISDGLSREIIQNFQAAVSRHEADQAIRRETCRERVGQ